MLKLKAAILALPALACLFNATSTANAVLLSTLTVPGASLVAGNATYIFDPKNPADFNDANIQVTAITTASGASAITFSKVIGAWNAPSDFTTVSFTASFTTPISSVGLDFVSAASGGALARAVETITNANHSIVYVPSLAVLNDGTGPFPDNFTATTSLGQNLTTFYVVKSIDMASGAGGAGSITSVTNTYFPVPEPASLTLLAAGMPLLMRRARRAR